MQLKILYEDNHLLVLEKPAGMLSQKDYRDEDSILEIAKDYIKTTYNKPGNVFLGLVHRLDRPVSGAMVFAKTSKAAGRLHTSFKNREVTKLYIALVPHSMRISADEQGWNKLKQYITRKGDYTHIAADNNRNAQTAELNYKVIFSDNHYQLLLIQLVTGRKHQIRAQLASLGIPIVGDTKYGSSEQLPGNCIGLHAVCIHFKHPVKDEYMECFASVPGYITGKINISQKDIYEIITLDIKQLNKLRYNL